MFYLPQFYLFKYVFQLILFIEKFSVKMKLFKKILRKNYDICGLKINKPNNIMNVNVLHADSLIELELVLEEHLVARAGGNKDTPTRTWRLRENICDKFFFLLLLSI